MSLAPLSLRSLRSFAAILPGTRLLATTLILALCAGPAHAEPAAPPPGTAPNLAERLCREYEQIRTVSCVVRKTRAGQGQTVRMLSRVYYEKPDRIHVDNASPVNRRIICDGVKLYYYQEGAPRGYARAVDALPEDWLRKLRTVPATPMEHLLRLRGLPEIELPGTDALPVRRGYQSRRRFVVLGCDKQGRLLRIDFYKTDKMQDLTACCEYDAYRNPKQLAWIPCLHKETVRMPEGDVTETKRIDNLAVNQPLATGLFVAERFFSEVEFSDEFRQTLQ